MAKHLTKSHLDFTVGCLINCLMSARIAAMLAQMNMQRDNGVGTDKDFICCYGQTYHRKWFYFHQTKADVKRQNLFRLGLKDIHRHRGQTATMAARSKEALAQWDEQFGAQNNYLLTIGNRQFLIRNELMDTKETGRPPKCCAWAWNLIAYDLLMKINEPYWRK